MQPHIEGKLPRALGQRHTLLSLLSAACCSALLHHLHQDSTFWLGLVSSISLTEAWVKVRLGLSQGLGARGAAADPCASVDACRPTCACSSLTLRQA